MGAGGEELLCPEPWSNRGVEKVREWLGGPSRTRDSRAVTQDLRGVKDQEEVSLIIKSYI